MKIVNDIKGLEEAALHASLLTASPKEGEIFLCSMQNAFLAVGESADRLYMKYGWDLSEFHTTEGKSIVYIVVTFDGYRFLKGQSMKLKVWNSDYTYSSLDDGIISFVQQFFDLLRSLLPDGFKLEYPLFRQTVTLELVDYLRTARMTSLIVTSTTAGVKLDSSDYFQIVENADWDFKKETLAIEAALAPAIRQQREDILSFAKSYQEALSHQRITNTHIYNIYNKSKNAYKGNIVLVKEFGNFVTFDDDAIVLANNLPVTIYTCRFEGRTSHIAALVNSEEFYKLTERDINIHVVNDNSKKVYQFGFTESFLNGKIPVGIDLTKDEGDFTDATVFKRSKGDYAVRASLGGRKLAEVEIPMNIGVYYQSLASSLEKRAWLYAVIHSVYGQLQSNQ